MPFLGLKLGRPKSDLLWARGSGRRRLRSGNGASVLREDVPAACGGSRKAGPAAPMLCGEPEGQVEDGGGEEDGVEEDGAEEEVVSAAPFADPISAGSGQSCRFLGRAWRTGTRR